MARRMIVGSAMVGALVCALAAPAAAHVSIDPPSVPKGSTAKLSFLVPNEERTAKTTRVEIFFPAPPNVIPGVSVEPKPGWKFSIKQLKLTTPIQTDDGTIDQVVSSIVWTANGTVNGIGADEFGEFTVDADGIPEKTDQLVFKAVQTYSDGKVVRWVDPVSANGPAADHPTPILKLTEGPGEVTPTSGATGSTSGTTTTASTQDDSARALGVIGIVVGGVGLVTATGALMRRRRA